MLRQYDYPLREGKCYFWFGRKDMIKMYLKNKLKPVNLTTLLYEIEENETYLLTTSVMNPLNRVKSPVKM